MVTSKDRAAKKISVSLPLFAFGPNAECGLKGVSSALKFPKLVLRQINQLRKPQQKLFIQSPCNGVFSPASSLIKVDLPRTIF